MFAYVMMKHNALEANSISFRGLLLFSSIPQNLLYGYSIQQNSYLLQNYQAQSMIVFGILALRATNAGSFRLPQELFKIDPFLTPI